MRVKISTFILEGIILLILVCLAIIIYDINYDTIDSNRKIDNENWRVERSIYVVACDETDSIVDGPGEPEIGFTYVPYYNSRKYLRGMVRHVVPADYKVAVYIKVGEEYWTKPYEIMRTISISCRGEWACSITTGGRDEKAVEIIAQLVPKDYIPAFAGGDSLPPDISFKKFPTVRKTRLFALMMYRLETRLLKPF